MLTLSTCNKKTIFGCPSSLKILLFLIAITNSMTACSGDSDSPPEAEPTPAPNPFSLSDKSLYITTDDQTPLATSIFFPSSEEPSNPSTTILLQTRYGREGEVAVEHGIDPAYQTWRQLGYVIVAVDVRGSTASFGTRLAEASREEVTDVDDIVTYIIDQPWSNGNVIVEGVSYNAIIADMSLSRPRPEIKGGVLRSLYFDTYSHVMMPGGVLIEPFFEVWGGDSVAIDFGRVIFELDDGSNIELDCAVSAEDCSSLIPFLVPVDGDSDFTLLRESLAGPNHWSLEDYRDITYRDDVADNGYTLSDSSSSAYLESIVVQDKPSQVWNSWMDAAAGASALARFASMPDAPMELWLTANTHNGQASADPFLTEGSDPIPNYEDQLNTMESFFTKILGGETIERIIHYYVIGDGTFKSSETWPPEDVENKNYYLSEDNILSEQRSDTSSQVIYPVDYSATTGEATRWTSPFDAQPNYPDRRDEVLKLLSFDLPAFESDMELVGTPVIYLNIATSSEDPTFHVYLQDVSPEGVVTYLTEGILRAVHRQPASELSYHSGLAAHSFRRDDSLPVIPGTALDIEFALLPIAARIRSGHHLRISLAGNDASLSIDPPGEGSDTFILTMGGENASAITLPLKEWE